MIWLFIFYRINGCLKIYRLSSFYSTSFLQLSSSFFDTFRSTKSIQPTTTAEKTMITTNISTTKSDIASSIFSWSTSLLRSTSSILHELLHCSSCPLIFKISSKQKMYHFRYVRSLISIPMRCTKLVGRFFMLVNR